MASNHILATGVFDLFHVGHLRYLQYARQKGTRLIVGVTPDAICLERKGRLPVIHESQRLEIIRGLGWVYQADYLPGSLDYTDDAVDWITGWGIDCVIPGGDWAGSPRWQRLTSALAMRGIDVHFAPRMHGISSSGIIAAIRARSETNAEEAEVS
ncbi:adenylyltransferase/cytidyltransferase family protein [Thiorhodococcus fuscus]|uniref:Adenylyltransferase/cytidyltransferase family protein n=1 Tax=Thiorhodococcus fuscus TaxID=527200 RepID=A0ABW4YBV1_9GAMM